MKIEAEPGEGDPRPLGPESPQRCGGVGERVVPTGWPDNPGPAHTEGEELSSAIQAATSVRTNKVTPIRFNLSDRCEVLLAEAGEAAMNEVLHRATFSPNGTGQLEVALNPDFLRSGISFTARGNPRMFVQDPLEPVLIQDV